MPRDLDGLADIVVLTVKNAMAPAFERIALLEKDNADLRTQLAVVTELRDRVVTVETKAAIPLSLVGTPSPPVTSLSLAEVEVAIRQRVDPISADLASVRERVIAVEVRQPIPGPAGQDGKDGVPGKDGLDGMGFDDLLVVQEDDRSFSIKALKGDRGRNIGTARFPVWIHRGVYIDSKAYEPGDVVTWAGSQWHCNEPTVTKPGEGLKTWTLIVKRGRDGKDGRDAIEPVPVVRVGGR